MKSLPLKDLESVLGLPCWQVRWDSQVGLDMNFGAPKMDIHEPKISGARSPRVRALFARRRVFFRGTHWLAITPFTWSIQLADGLRASASSSAKRQDIVCHRLGGERLEAIRFRPQFESASRMSIDPRISAAFEKHNGFQLEPHLVVLGLMGQRWGEISVIVSSFTLPL